MSTFVVVGAGMAGLAVTLALGRLEHRVILCERDTAPVPVDTEEMWMAWDRPGTPQAHLAHIFNPRFCQEMRRHAPDILDRAREAGALPFNVHVHRPGGDPLPEDEEMDSLYCRRSIMEGLVRHAVEVQPTVEMRAGCAVSGLLTDMSESDGLPRVIGVRTRDGVHLHADAVIIAGGRHLPLAAWFQAIGAATPEEVSDGCGMLYYGRYFRAQPTADNPTGSAPPILIRDLGYVQIGIIPGDNGSFNVLVSPSHSDRELRVLGNEDAFMAVARSVPAIAPWLTTETSMAIGGVEAMGRLNNLLRRFIINDRPLALGLFVIGDARCHTNPTLGWGSGLGVSQAFALADVLTGVPANPLGQALSFESRVAGELLGWHHLVVEMDRARARVWQGGQDSPPPHFDTDFEAFVRTVVTPAAQIDPTVFRAYHRRRSLLDPPEALRSNEAVLERSTTLAAHCHLLAETPGAHGPTRAEMLAIITSTRAAATST